jgi:hypothetical protein
MARRSVPAKGPDWSPEKTLPLLQEQLRQLRCSQRVLSYSQTGHVIVARLSGAVGATREALIAAFCRLDKSLSCCWEKGWLVGAVGIEPLRVIDTA